VALICGLLSVVAFMWGLLDVVALIFRNFKDLVSPKRRGCAADKCLQRSLPFWDTFFPYLNRQLRNQDTLFWMLSVPFCGCFFSLFWTPSYFKLLTSFSARPMAWLAKTWGTPHICIQQFTLTQFYLHSNISISPL